MTDIRFEQGNGHWQLIVDGKYTDVGVNTRNGYAIYKRHDSRIAELPIADRLGDLIGRRISQKFTDTMALAEIAKRLAE